MGGRKGEWQKIRKQAYTDQVLLCSGAFAMEVVVWYLGLLMWVKVLLS